MWVSRRAWTGRFFGPIFAAIAYVALPVGQDGLSRTVVASEYSFAYVVSWVESE